MHWVRSWFHISGRITDESGDATPGRAAQRNSCWLRWHRRCANGNLSVAFSRRMESGRPHSAKAFRADQESANASVSRRSCPFPQNFAGGVCRLRRGYGGQEIVEELKCYNGPCHVERSET